MSYSVYSDITWDGATVYGYVSGYDNSWGCIHGEYQVDAWLSSPTRSADTGALPGTAASLYLDFGGEDGTWTLTSAASLLCSCAQATVLVGATPTSQQLQRKPTYVAIIGTPRYTLGPPAPYVYNVNRQILDQFRQPLNGVRFVHEYFLPDPPSGNCTTLAVQSRSDNSDAYGIFGPDLYTLPGNAHNPCSSSSTQHLEVDGMPVTPTYAVTWQYSGVTVSPQ
jgi:hypothetical protein